MMRENILNTVFKLSPPSSEDFNDNPSSPLSRCHKCLQLAESEATAEMADSGDRVCLDCVDIDDKLIACQECGMVIDTRRHEFCPSCGLTLKED